MIFLSLWDFFIESSYRRKSVSIIMTMDLRLRGNDVQLIARFDYNIN